MATCLAFPFHVAKVAKKTKGSFVGRNFFCRSEKSCYETPDVSISKHNAGMQKTAVNRVSKSGLTNSAYMV